MHFFCTNHSMQGFNIYHILIQHLQLLCMDTGCSLADLPEEMEERERNGERELGKLVLTA